MRDALLSLLSKDWSGLLVAALVAALGGLALAWGWPGWLAGGPIALGALLAAGALWHLWCVQRAVRAHPAPGRLVAVQGWRMHVLAEGTQRDGRAAVVWFGGGHVSGAGMAHLHRQLRDHTRSILVDRPGTGWSDAGPFPRSTAREADECLAALEAALEPGPFVFVGHSFGGLLAANMARRRPDLVAAVVLLDATPPDTIIYGPRLGALREMRRGALLCGLGRLFGVHEGPLERAQRQQAPQVFEQMERLLGDAWRTDRALGVRSRSFLTTASIFQELSAEGMARVAWETAVYEGDLGDLPVLLVAPGDAAEVGRLPEIANAQQREAQRMCRVIARTRERYLTVSTRARRVVTPEGTGHNFPFEVPDFVAQVVRQAVDETARR